MTRPPTAPLSLVSTRTCPLLGCTPKGRAECCPAGCSQRSSLPLPSQLDSSCRNGFSTNKYNIIVKENAQARREGGLKGEGKLPRTSQRLGRRGGSAVAQKYKVQVHRAVDTTCIRPSPGAGPTVWNSLPEELTDPACVIDSFKRFFKTILFSQY